MTVSLVMLSLLPIYLLGAGVATALAIVTVLDRHPTPLALTSIAAAAMTIAAAAATASSASVRYPTVPGSVFVLAATVCVTTGAIAGTLYAAPHLIPRVTERN